MEKVYKNYDAENVKIISINASDRKSKVIKDLEGDELSYPVTAARKTSILKDYKIRMIPMVVIIDKSGRIKLSKMFLQYNAMKEILDTLISMENNEIK